MTALADLKSQLSLAEDEAEDAFLSAKIAAAEAFTTSTIGAEDPITYGDAPADLQQAILMLAAHWFENREASLADGTLNEVPLGYRELVSTYRQWAF